MPTKVKRQVKRQAVNKPSIDTRFRNELRFDANREARRRADSESAGRKKLKGKITKAQTERSKVWKESTKSKTSPREVSRKDWNKFEKAANKEQKLSWRKHIAGKDLQKRESVSSERQSSPAQSKDVKKGTGAVKPKKQAVRKVSMSKRITKGIARATPIGKAATIGSLLGTGAAMLGKAKAKGIAKKGVGGTANMKKINTFRAKTPSQAHTKARRKLKSRRK